MSRINDIVNERLEHRQIRRKLKDEEFKLT